MHQKQEQTLTLKNWRQQQFGNKIMTTYILINSSDNNILGVYTDRKVACTMMRAFNSCNGNNIACLTTEVTDNVPAWAKRVLELA